jgi:Holliday junction resolvase-like predicted endonuclease
MVRKGVIYFIEIKTRSFNQLPVDYPTFSKRQFARTTSLAKEYLIENGFLSLDYYFQKVLVIYRAGRISPFQITPQNAFQ